MTSKNTHLAEQREMYYKIRKYDNEIQKRKFKRVIKLLLILTVIFFCVDIFWFKNKDIIDALILAIIYAVLYFFSGSIIFSLMIDASNVENKHLEDLKKEYHDKFGTTWW